MLYKVFVQKVFISISVFGLRQFTRDKFHVHWQGDRRLLCGPGDLVPDVPRVHGGPE